MGPTPQRGDERPAAADEQDDPSADAAESSDGAAPADSTADATQSLPAETPSGPDGLPLVGNTLPFVRDPFEWYDVLAEHGDVVSWRFAWFDVVSLFHPDQIERVLLTDWERYGKANFGDVGVDFAPEGLVFAEGDQWRAQRSVLQDVFTFDRIQSYGESMVEGAVDHVEAWPDGEPVALNERFSELSLEVLARTLLDVELDDERGDVVTRFANAVNDRADLRNVSTLLPSWIPTPAERRWRRASADFESLLDELIAERRASDGLEQRDDLLSRLLYAEGADGYTHSERELRDQLETFLFAGHDTTSLALTYTCLLLAQHDDVRRRLREEWDDALGDERPSVADLPQLEYTDRVVSEALRLYPPVPVILRQAREDTELGGYRIPEGTRVALPQFKLHTDERFYDDPEAFDPDRWTDEFEAELPDYAYFPFGGGPRHCIGMRFARMELKLVLPIVLRAVELELLSDPDPDIVPGATARPEEDVRMRVHRRD